MTSRSGVTSPTAALLRSLVLAAAASGCMGGEYSLGIDCLTSGTDRDLQAALDKQSRVLLCPRATFVLDSPVILRANRTLETFHRPSQPADMATIILGPEFTSQDIGVGGPASNITIASVRFDGNRRGLGARDRLQLLGVGPGTNYQLIGNSFTDTPGWTHVHVTEPCSMATIVRNTVESAVRPHDANGHFADGLSISCANTLIADNTINDISGVGIVYFGGPGTIIRNNVIVESTTDASSGINVGDAVRMDHTGVVISDNVIKAVGTHYFHVGIAAGLRVWPMRTKDIRGVTVRGNIISGMTRYGLAVDGCLDCVIQENEVRDWQGLPTVPPCPPSVPYIANAAAGHASGMLQTGYADANIDGCIGLPAGQ